MKRKRTDHQPRTVSYLRVSTEGQDTEKNKAAILAFANQKDFGQVEFIEEKVSGMLSWRERKLGQLIDDLNSEDRLIVPEISRLGRASMFEIMEILSVAKSKGIAIYDIKNGWELNGSLQSEVMAFAFSIAAKIERDLISSRTKEALAARKAAGVKLGRPKGVGKSMLDPHREAICEQLRQGITKTEIAAAYGCTSANLINWMKKNEIDPWEEE
jgi:DNA invertase Pin-like site-specific DNA recombinase